MSYGRSKKFWAFVQVLVRAYTLRAKQIMTSKQLSIKNLRKPCAIDLVGWELKTDIPIFRQHLYFLQERASLLITYSRKTQNGIIIWIIINEPEFWKKFKFPMPNCSKCSLQGSVSWKSIKEKSSLPQNISISWIVRRAWKKTISNAGIGTSTRQIRTICCNARIIPQSYYMEPLNRRLRKMLLVVTI